jgi:hypothetical protein
MAGTAQEKKRTIIYIALDVLEYLAIRRVEGAGSVSRQLESMVRAQMPKHLDRHEIAKLEAQELEGYTNHPITEEESGDWLDEEV